MVKLRMQSEVFPTNYKITIEPDLKTFTFKGTELITLQLEKNVPTISLDAVNIQVETCFLIDGGERIALKFEVKNNKLEIQTNNKLEDGQNEVEIEFIGEHNDKLAGFYRSEYIENGKKKYLVTTQFEAADARQAFPCFDEPIYKATFDITLVVDKELNAISNMPRKEIKMLGNGKKSVSFEKTPKMSTYLVYMGVGELEINHQKYKNIDLRGITVKGRSQYTEFAIEVAKKTLAYFEDYFQFEYPLPKLDLIAIPDFAAGAMENWGAVTFRENALLFYPGTSSLTTKQRVAEVVAHELAHQWFGNLVTMKWWDDLWLNESFATFMAYKLLDHAWPEWNIWTDYVINTVFEGMWLDSLKNSHSIKVKVNSVDELSELFDEIAYEKGGSILRMVEGFMGNEQFKKGLRSYIQTFQYKNSEAHDLWLSLEKAGKQKVVEMVEGFITQVGFPYVKISMNQDKIDLCQKRFLFEKEDNTKWEIPFVNKLSEKNKSLLSINADYGAFFISEYDTSLLKQIGNHISELNNKEKIGLIHDLYFLSKFQKQSLEVFISFITTYFATEKDSSVLFYLLDVLSEIQLLLDNTAIEKLVRLYATKSLGIVGIEPKDNESTYNTFLRSIALSTLTDLNDDQVVSFLNTKFAEYLESPKKLHPDLKVATFNNAVWSNDKNYEIVLKMYRESSSQEEQVKLLQALTRSKKAKTVKKALDFCLSTEVRFSNLYVGVISASKNPYGKEVVFEWLLDNWKELGKRVGGIGGTMLRREVQAILPIAGIGQEQKVKEFMKQKEVSGLEKTFKQAWEELQINAAFVRINKK